MLRVRGPRTRFIAAVPIKKERLVYRAESVSYPFEVGLGGRGARERDDVKATGRRFAVRLGGGSEIELGGEGQAALLGGGHGGCGVSPQGVASVAHFHERPEPVLGGG